MQKRQGLTIAVLLTLPLLIVLYAAFGLRGNADWNSAAFLLTVAALAASISGIGFAIYGFYNASLVGDIVDDKVQKRLSERLAELDQRFQTLEQQFQAESIKAQEAIQKIIAGYNVQFQAGDLDAAISLYTQAVEVWPKVYNGYTSLAYAYLQKNDVINARKNFGLAITVHPESYQALNDMARFLAMQGEKTSAFEYLEKTLNLCPQAWHDIEQDSSFDVLQKAYPDQFNRLLQKARKVSGNSDKPA